jgi:hypothetical protein
MSAKMLPPQDEQAIWAWAECLVSEVFSAGFAKSFSPSDEIVERALALYWAGVSPADAAIAIFGKLH